MPIIRSVSSRAKRTGTMSAQVIFLPPRPTSYEEARKHQVMQDKINEHRAKFNNWTIGKTPFQIARAMVAFRNAFLGKIHLVKETDLQNCEESHYY